MEVKVRFAKEDELERINELRKQGNDLHVAGKPDVFNSLCLIDNYDFSSRVSARSCGILFM